MQGDPSLESCGTVADDLGGHGQSSPGCSVAGVCTCSVLRLGQSIPSHARDQDQQALRPGQQGGGDRAVGSLTDAHLRAPYQSVRPDRRAGGRNRSGRRIVAAWSAPGAYEAVRIVRPVSETTYSFVCWSTWTAYMV